MSRYLKLQNEGKNETGKVHCTKKMKGRKMRGKVSTIPSPDENFSNEYTRIFFAKGNRLPQHKSC